MVILLLISKALHTCPDIPGSKEIFFASPIGLYRHSVAFNLILKDLIYFFFCHSGAHCVHGRKKMLWNNQHVPRYMLIKNLFEIPLHTVPKQLKTGPGSNLGQGSLNSIACHFKLFSFNCRAKNIIFTHFVKFLWWHSAPIGCNLNYAKFHEIPALGLIQPRNPGLGGI